MIVEDVGNMEYRLPVIKFAGRWVIRRSIHYDDAVRVADRQQAAESLNEAVG